MGARATADGVGAGDGAGGVTSLPPELDWNRRAFVFFVWIEMEKARGDACVYIARDL
jgi:hypothetical protein